MSTASQTEPSLTALQIPGYRILRPLGQGGMATVYLAVQESFDRQVALKVMASALATTDKTYGERFLREARIVAKLIDPHIVTVYDVGISNGLHYLAMEYVPGSDLRAHRAAMTLKQCLVAVKQIAQALEHAHHQGYIHRDIKPENILIHRHSGRAVLSDFGIARPVGSDDDSLQQGGAIGTPSFMSPEQALGQPLDHRSDLYSLGIVTFYLLTGQPPFIGDSPVVVSMKHALDAIPRLPTALQVAQKLIDTALAKHPDQRFQSGQQFAEAIDTLLVQIGEREERFWALSLHDNPSSPETTRLSINEPTRLPAQPMSVTAPNPIAVAHVAAMIPQAGDDRSQWFARLQRGGQQAASLLARFGTQLWSGLQIAGRFLWAQLIRFMPVLLRAGNAVSRQGQQLWRNRTPQTLSIAAVVLLAAVLAWLLRDDWNVRSVRQAFHDGELTKAEYNAIVKTLKAEHQARVAELRQALEDDELNREEYLAALNEAKQEYTGEENCGSWFGC